jgi:nitroimidazol reductase NimA-like FMN-containing flavoprotein (pyridoxamine 5'-phosphate oxidase superfamily)
VNPSTPTFRILDDSACAALLAAHHIGRIAFGYYGRVDIQPIHYVWDQGSVYGRTRDGTKLRAITANRLVAFEIDEVAAMYDWRSVVVKGTLDLLSAEETPAEMAHAVALLRRIVPEAFAEHDPTPERTNVFRIRAETITGRAATP